ncbi:MAG: hypothetical protein GY710_12265 [Desulfobacteraceae bacterium]|nr:hypothetical protein [Desulfobacteraceae bacterium]
MKKLMVIALLLVFATGSAWAADWKFYGEARVSTFYTDAKNDPFSSSTAALGITTGSDTGNYEENLYGSARIGAKIQVSDELKAHLQYGTLGGNANIRILWAEWNFGAGALGVGQNYTPLIFPYSNQVYSIAPINKGDHDMSTFGMLYGSRKAMIQLKFGKFRIAAVEAKTLVALPVARTAAGDSQPTTEVKFPSIQAKYQYDFSKGHIAAAAGYQTFDVVSNGDHSVDSYVIGLGGRLDVGAAYFKGNIWGGQNVGNLADILVSGDTWSTAANAGSGNFDGLGWGLAQWNSTTNTITDNDAFAGLFVAGYEIRKGLYLEAGYGYVRTELDSSGAVDYDVHTFYLQSTIFLAPGVFITPEIGMVDMKEGDEPVMRYAGIKWQINF